MMFAMIESRKVGSSDSYGCRNLEEGCGDARGESRLAMASDYSSLTSGGYCDEMNEVEDER